MKIGEEDLEMKKSMGTQNVRGEGRGRDKRTEIQKDKTRVLKLGIERR
jgi:hypothetical protein